MPVRAQEGTATYSDADRTTPSIAVEKRGDNLYLVGRGFQPKKNVDTSGRFRIVCAMPNCAAKVNFQFADGSYYEYAPREVWAGTSFAVLLRGEVMLPDERHGLDRLLKKRESVHGDEALLRWLQTRELERVRYAEEYSVYEKGREVKKYSPDARTYMSPTVFEEIRKELNKSAL